MRKFINKILNVPKLILTIWIMLWVILVILLIMKFCAGIWYPIVVDNDTFMNICNFIDNNKVAFYIIFVMFYILNFILGFLTSTGRPKFNKWYSYIIIILLSVGTFFTKNFNNALGLVLEIFFVVMFPIILNLKEKKFKNKIFDIIIPIIYYLLINLWQLMIYLVRDLDTNILATMPSLIILILQIDYYIFLIITWIGVTRMGIIGLGWLWSKDITVLKAEKAKELAKANPDMDKVAEIEDRIVELEKEGK